MANKRGERFMALLLAALFLFSSVAVAGFVVWTIRKDNSDAAKQNAAQTAATDAAKQQQDNNSQPKQKMENFTPTTTPVTQLQKTDTVVGTGTEAKPGDKVTVNYTGALMSTGEIFDSSIPRGQPATFGLNEVIKGWTDGVPGMKVGGKRRLLIPYAQAYGEQGNPPTIPAKADLVFDIELLAVNP